MPNREPYNWRDHQRRIEAYYDETMIALQQYSGGFHNFGYWTPETDSWERASIELVEQILAPVEQKRGRILDVACGLGASTRHLLNYYDASNIAAINISKRQIEWAHKAVAGVDFLIMDAVELGFGDERFDTVLCVEAAFHFDTRERFLREALRVLKPGGYLVLSDILGARLPAATARRAHLPPANHIEYPAEYAFRLSRLGYEDIAVTDATPNCWQAFRRSALRWPLEQRRAGNITLLQQVVLSLALTVNLAKLATFVRRYLLVSARKPLAA